MEKTPPTSATKTACTNDPPSSPTTTTGGINHKNDGEWNTVGGKNTTPFLKATPPGKEKSPTVTDNGRTSPYNEEFMSAGEDEKEDEKDDDDVNEENDANKVITTDQKKDKSDKVHDLRFPCIGS